MQRLRSAILLLLLGVLAVDAAKTISEHNVDPADIDYQNATVVNLKNISIREIPGNYFSDLDLDLSLLVITNSQLVNIDEHAFDGLDHLNKLVLSNDQITTIKPHTFSRLKGLELLQLDWNRLRDVSLVLNNVQEIVLAHNDIDRLGEKFLSGDSVTFVDLRSNKLTLLEHSMASLTKLATIYLSNNRIAEIKPEVFEHNDNLMRIYASGNQLTSTEGVKLKQLRSLDISSNKLRRLNKDSFAEMIFLDDLSLNNNMISDLGDAFAEVKSLLYLDLSDNEITKIDPNLFRNNQNLSKLKLAKNKLMELKRFSNNLRHLTVLDLSHNMIENIDRDFFLSIEKLEILDLSFNRLSKIGNLLQPLRNLASLDMSNNQLVFEKDTIRSNLRLNRLNVSSNGLDIRMSDLAGSTHLKYLDLSKNNITDFCDTEFSLEALTIDLSHNNIKSLSCFKTFNFLPFAIINIRNNPLTCDHDLDDVIFHFILLNSSPNETVNSGWTQNIRTNQDLWNSVKREICPNGLDINIGRVLDKLNSTFGAQEEDDDDDENSDDIDASYYYYYYDADEEKVTMKPRESTEYSDEDNHLEIEIRKHIEDDIHSVEQSERESWKTISKTKNIAPENEEDIASKIYLLINRSHLSLFTLSLIFIGVSLLLVLINVAIFMFVRAKWWKKDFRGPQKYTHLENKVYKDTTVPNDYSALGGKKSDDSYGISCARMFTNFGFRTAEDDIESVKKMIVDGNPKAEV